jgi:hypothetical protein
VQSESKRYKSDQALYELYIKYGMLEIDSNYRRDEGKKRDKT